MLKSRPIADVIQYYSITKWTGTAMLIFYQIKKKKKNSINYFLIFFYFLITLCHTEFKKMLVNFYKNPKLTVIRTD